ncbi:MAG: hypothetical protein Q4B58_07050 [Bacteroidales bacterium]|nr:hypothetical protein [Bacteroidales bacterium]
MKRILYLFAACVCIAIYASCTDSKTKQQLTESQSQNDSLMTIVLRQNNDLAELVSTLNDVTAQLDEVNGQLSLSSNDETLMGRRKRLMEQLETVKQRIKVKEDELESLQKKYKNVLGENKELQKCVKRMREEIAAFQDNIVNLENTVATQSAQIGQLSATLNETQEALAEQTATSEVQKALIDNQDKMINTGFYIVGSKKELKEMGIIEGGLFNKKRITSKGFNTSVFTQIDIREVTEIQLGSGNPRILSSAPESSYELVKDADKQVTLRILDPVAFWSLSKYLVVLNK